jgi:hypothetical protein
MCHTAIAAVSVVLAVLFGFRELKVPFAHVYSGYEALYWLVAGVY